METVELLGSLSDVKRNLTDDKIRLVQSDDLFRQTASNDRDGFSESASDDRDVIAF
jgi:hypothetical protein